MKQVGLLLRAQAAEWKNRKRTVILTGIVLIIGMISTFSYVKNHVAEEAAFTKLSLGVANEDESEYSKILISYFMENETFSSYVDVVQETEDVLWERLKTGELDAYLSVPAGFAEGLMNMEHLPMKAVVSMRQLTKALVFAQVLSAYETYIKTVEVNCTALYDRMREEGFSKADLTKANLDISLDLIFTALGKDDFFRIRMVERETEVSLADHYLFTALFFVGMFFYLPAGFRMLKLRGNGMLHRLKTMQVPVWKVLFATALPYVTGTMLCVAMFLLIFKEWELTVFLCAVSLCLTVLFFVLLLSALVRKKKDYLFAFGILLLVLSVPGGGIVPKQYLPDVFAHLTELLPNENLILLMTGNLERVGQTVVAAFVAVAVTFLVTALYLDKRGEAQKDA